MLTDSCGSWLNLYCSAVCNCQVRREGREAPVTQTTPFFSGDKNKHINYCNKKNPPTLWPRHYIASVIFIKKCGQDESWIWICDWYRMFGVEVRRLITLARQVLLHWVVSHSLHGVSNSCQSMQMVSHKQRPRIDALAHWCEQAQNSHPRFLGTVRVSVSTVWTPGLGWHSADRKLGEANKTLDWCVLAISLACHMFIPTCRPSLQKGKRITGQSNRPETVNSEHVRVCFIMFCLRTFADVRQSGQIEFMHTSVSWRNIVVIDLYSFLPLSSSAKFWKLCCVCYSFFFLAI